MQPQQWREAMMAAKLAVRAYARDPSSSNAAEVELAWQRVRRLKSVAEWRRPSRVGAGASRDIHRRSMKRSKICLRPSSSTRRLASSTVSHARLRVLASGQSATSSSTSMAKTWTVQVPPHFRY